MGELDLAKTQAHDVRDPTYDPGGPEPVIRLL
jgi:hypothetical protein